MANDRINSKSFKEGDRIILIKHDNFSEGQGLRIGDAYVVARDCLAGSDWVYIKDPNNCYYPSSFVKEGDKSAASAIRKDAATKKKRDALIAAEKAKAEKEASKRARIMTKISGGKVVFSPVMDDLIKDFGCHESKCRAIMDRLFVELKRK